MTLQVKIILFQTEALYTFYICEMQCATNAFSHQFSTSWTRLTCLLSVTWWRWWHNIKFKFNSLPFIMQRCYYGKQRWRIYAVGAFRTTRPASLYLYHVRFIVCFTQYISVDILQIWFLYWYNLDKVWFWHAYTKRELSSLIVKTLFIYRTIHQIPLDINYSWENLNWNYI